MARDEQLKERYEAVVQKLADRFAEGDTGAMDLDSIIYLIGIQELGQLDKTFKKDEKMNLMHIAIYDDPDGWPHYKVLEALPPLKAGEQQILMKDAIVQYFLEKGLIS